MRMNNPKCILLFSGKRKSGKDFITDQLLERVGSCQCSIIRLSAPIKSHWAKLNDLAFDELLAATEYKEKYRADMIKWSESMRLGDSGYFIRPAIEIAKAKEKPIWIVSDMRRKSDLNWFCQHYPNICHPIRITCQEQTRKERGWIFTPGIDDAESECDLDDMSNWSWQIQNDGTLQDLEPILLEIINFARHQSAITLKPDMTT